MNLSFLTQFAATHWPSLVHYGAALGLLAVGGFAGYLLSRKPSPVTSRPQARPQPVTATLPTLVPRRWPANAAPSRFGDEPVVVTEYRADPLPVLAPRKVVPGQVLAADEPLPKLRRRDDAGIWEFADDPDDDEWLAMVNALADEERTVQRERRERHEARQEEPEPDWLTELLSENGVKVPSLSR